MEIERIPASYVVQERVAKASGIPLDGGSVADLFTISGGPVQLLALIAEVTEAVSATSCTMKLVANPTVGNDTNLCEVVNLFNAAIGFFFSIDGTIANAMVKAVPGTALPLGIGMDIPLVLPVGTVDLNLSNSNPTSGIATFYLRYKPLTENARVIS